MGWAVPLTLPSVSRKEAAHGCGGRSWDAGRVRSPRPAVLVPAGTAVQAHQPPRWEAEPPALGRSHLGHVQRGWPGPGAWLLPPARSVPASGLLAAKSSLAAHPGGGDARPEPSCPPGPFLGRPCTPLLPLDTGFCLRQGCVQDLGLWAAGLAVGWGSVHGAAGLEPWGLRLAGWLMLPQELQEGGAGQSPLRPLGARRGCWALGVAVRQRISQDGSREASWGPLSSAWWPGGAVGGAECRAGSVFWGWAGGGVAWGARPGRGWGA